MNCTPDELTGETTKVQIRREVDLLADLFVRNASG